MVDSLPPLPIKVSAFMQILYHTQADESQVQHIVDLSQVCTKDPWQRAASYYELAKSLPAEMEEWARRLIELAEPLLTEEPLYEISKFGIRTRVGPSRTRLKILKAQALLTLIKPDRFTQVEEAMRAIDTLTQLSDKLQVLDILAEQAADWSEEDKLALLWHVWEVVVSCNLNDAQALLASSIPLVHLLGGADAFWRLYGYVEWAYEGLAQVDS
jgi:hypothetical protein